MSDTEAAIAGWATAIVELTGISPTLQVLPEGAAYTDSGYQWQASDGRLNYVAATPLAAMRGLYEFVKSTPEER